MLEHTGLARDVELIAQHDLVLTTYGTLLRDAPQLAEIEFDYVVLDEAQAIKNAATASAKAVRLLRGEHRLALSGTPVENHLGELWSLFEFLNPGMLGEAKVLKLAGGLARNPSEEARAAAGARPAAIHPAAHQTAGGARTSGEDRADHLLRTGRLRSGSTTTNCASTTANPCCSECKQQGLGRSKMHVLEALLRLRQAACHPGLLDAKRVEAIRAPSWTCCWNSWPSLREEGHKALVFSQFTSLLAIVRSRLDERRRELRVPGRRHAQPAGARGGLSERSGLLGCS